MTSLDLASAYIGGLFSNSKSLLVKSNSPVKVRKFLVTKILQYYLKCACATDCEGFLSTSI